MGEEETEEVEEIQPEDWPILVRWLRGIPGWDQAELAAAAGIHPSSVSRYEAGKLIPPPGTVERLAGAVGTPISFVYAVFLPVIRTIRSLYRGQIPQDLEDVLASLVRSLSGAFRAETAALLFDLAPEATRQARPPVALPCAEDLAVAADLFKRLEPCTTEEQEFLVENAPEFHHWGLAVRLAEASENTAARDACRSLHLTRLARRVAGLANLDPAFRPGLEGYLEGFFANALRVKSDLPAAKAAFQRSRKLWKEGGGAWAGLLPEWRLPDLEASLCRAQRRWAEALDLLDHAHVLAPAEDVGRVLLKRSSVLVLMGEGDAAVEVLRAAAPRVDGRRDPRLLFGLRFNLAATLVLLERYPEAEELLPEVQELAQGLGNELDLVRYRWLEGQVGSGRGRLEEAIAAFEEVLGEFTHHELAYDAALVALELSVLYLEQGRTGEVKGLAAGMAWIFDAQGVDEETLKALALFREAAEREAVTAGLARRLVEQLNRARQGSDR